MRKYRLLFGSAILATLAVLGGTAGAKYARPQLVKVPIDRVLKNLAEQSAEKPKDGLLKANLARAHAMAYASKAEELDTKEGDIWFGYEPKNVPFEVKPTDDKKVQAEAKKHLAKAIEVYEQSLKLAPDNDVARLGYAWCLDQADKDKEAIAQYRKVAAVAWDREGAATEANLGQHFVTIEAAGYLIPHLDKTKDAKEIAELEARSKKLANVPRPMTPIAIPLRDGLSATDIEDRAASVAFDVDGSAIAARRWTWIKPNAGWLVIDRNRSGKVDSALQLFGNVTFWMFWQNGYEPLAALDDNHDGELRGAELDGLAIWHDANSNGKSDVGEVRQLGEHGIVALSCAHKTDTAHRDRIEYSASGVTFADGKTWPTYDVLLHRQPDAATRAAAN